MGVLNVTPDSFSDAGKYMDSERALDCALGMAEEGADIIDVGGESSRPGAKPITAKEELKRILPVVRKLAQKLKIPVSVDTYKSSVAREALSSGASIINDITGLKFDSLMAETISSYNAGVVLTHIKGLPRTMQENPYYDDVIREIKKELACSIKIANSAGIRAYNIVIDPGIGFGKTVEHNLTIIRELEKFKTLKKPILIGLSRKAFIGAITNKTVANRLYGTIAANVVAIMNGADIIRVHDVVPAKDSCAILNMLTSTPKNILMPLLSKVKRK
ncbi:dihydropteroate synthase [Candidatus Omnitrophus magneticus]|uniref:Dihydropteroate synthase n=1 Tax=Candidatus Omnitrophus magneticus TaxID=1609969 RepID=A0A0F0CJE8_9BACT|nr:dihydropteroate synthase [Candidatus Omnitrophus magneticus]